MASDDPRRRLFLALQPPQALRQQLARVVAEHCPELKAADVTASESTRSGIRPVPVANLHMTLVFLGSITAQVQACVEQVAAKVVVPAFSISFDRLGYWPRQRMLWAMPNPTPGLKLDSDSQQRALTVLVELLHQGLQGCDVRLDLRPYRPHVTLARKLARGPRDGRIQAVEWPFTHFSLLESLSTPTGVRYPVLQSWPLSNA